MDDTRLVERFEEHRPRLRAVAYRMLGSLTEADDAVQETWLRLRRTVEETETRIDDLTGWLITVVARVCLNLIRARDARREEPAEVFVPDPVIGTDPEQEAVLADAVGLALLVVLHTLSPAERLAFVLHDMFSVPFEEIAELTDRTPAAARQLASRARRRVRDRAPAPDPDVASQREVVDAFFAAAREGDLDALVAVLDPDVVLRADGGTGRGRPTFVARGTQAVLGNVVTGGRMDALVRPVLVNGAAGVLVGTPGRPLSVMAFTVTGGRIVAIDVLWDPDRLAGLPNI